VELPLDRFLLMTLLGTPFCEIPITIHGLLPRLIHHSLRSPHGSAYITFVAGYPDGGAELSVPPPPLFSPHFLRLLSRVLPRLRACWLSKCVLTIILFTFAWLPFRETISCTCFSSFFLPDACLSFHNFFFLEPSMRSRSTPPPLPELMLVTNNLFLFICHPLSFWH